MYAKKNGRVTFRSNRRQGFKRNNNYSNLKFRNKGNASQQYQKYLKLATEASAAGDRIQSEYYYQFADHYSRLMIELGIVIDENLYNKDSLDIKSVEQKENFDDKSIDNSESSIDTKDEETESNVDSDKEDNDKEDNDKEDNDNESIKSVPFISQSMKKKSPKIKKKPV